jgi:cysteine desulfurase family protein
MEHTGNVGRGAYGSALSGARCVYEARETLAHFFGAEDPSRIAFAANATEALNAAIRGLFLPGDHIISTVCEHNSVLRPLYLLEKEGVEVTYIGTDAYGMLDYPAMEQAVKPGTKAIIVTHASNLTGNLTDLARVRAITKKRGLLLIVDASQSAGSVPIHVRDMGIDVLCFTGHKGLMGPQGTGGIYVREDLAIRPFKVGGSGILSFEREHPGRMPEVLEAGTLNVHGIAGLLAAVKYIEETGLSHIREIELERVRQFQEGIASIKELRLYGNPDPAKRVGIASVNLGSEDSAQVADELWETYEICVRGGAHCAPRMHEALGTACQGAVRFSFSSFTTEEEVDSAIRALRELQEA